VLIQLAALLQLVSPTDLPVDQRMTENELRPVHRRDRGTVQTAGLFREARHSLAALLRRILRVLELERAALRVSGRELVEPESLPSAREIVSMQPDYH
jgi:hypothetical protein